MRRTQIYLDEAQDQKLSKRARSAGITKSSLIRRAINAFLNAPAGAATELARFRAALNEAASSPASFESGRSYVEALRAGDVRRQEDIERRRR